ncbi:response regulator [Mucilaginibacter agri]|uniref:Response regulator n=1 Tax=Mucilaginibacter agri TaxID=2695265 RepID=A0A965ZG33_9SPHI|nr:response regulator [Mucilaginibacter agri]NCD70320.1 response regulator [Mucilaginibacter agri]
MSKRILVVDDDPGVLEVLTDILCEYQFDVKPITRGEKVFDEINGYHPDLILMDVMLSGMDGRNICKSIKSDPKLNWIPVILLSANVNAYNVMFDKGAPNDFLSKPFDMNNLIDRIERQLTA